MGKVYAVDVDQKLLDILIKKAKEKGIKNIVPVLAAENNSKLPEKSVDMIFVRNVFHYLTGHVEYFKKIKKVLKPEGVIAIVEHNGKGFFMKLASHYTLPADVVKKMNAAGYRVVKKFEYLKYESFIIFEVNPDYK